MYVLDFIRFSLGVSRKTIIPWFMVIASQFRDIHRKIHTFRDLAVSWQVDRDINKSCGCGS